MLAINHAFSGALLGLTVGEPWVAVPLAFLSHFAQDAVPHYDLPGDETARLRHTSFARQLVVDAVLCGILVLILALIRPKHWISAAICAFLATSPDLMWIRKFWQTRFKACESTNIFPWERFHTKIQWRTGRGLWWVEAMWFVGGSFLLWLLL